MLSIKQAFKARDNAHQKQLKQIWQTSVDVAAVCRVLAKTQPGLDVEHAMLAGLIHNIGCLPIIELADRQPSLFSDNQNIIDVTNEIQSELGEKILSFWNFPDSLINVTRYWNQYTRNHESTADYVDIVQAAILHTNHAHNSWPDDWSKFPAISKLGLDPSVRNLDESLQIELDDTRKSLMQA